MPATDLEYVSSPAPPPRRRAGLSLLREIGTEAKPARWRYWIVRIEPTGRITLPADARPFIDAEGKTMVRAVCRGMTLVLRRGGLGSSVSIDGRGRFALPMWLRRAAEPAGAVLVAARLLDVPVLLVSPTAVVDELADGLAGEER